MKSPDLAAIVRYHRDRAGLTQAGLARLAGVGKTVVFDIEHGKRTIRVQTLYCVLGALNIRLDWSSPLKADFLASLAASSRTADSGPEVT